MIRKNKGYILMILGILLPLYSLTSISYNELKSVYNYNKYNKATVSDDKKRSIEKFTKEYNDKINTNSRGIVDPFVYSDYNSNYGFQILGSSAAFGYLYIPKIDLYKPILLDATEENLSKGLAHVDGTNLPVGGESTRSVIAGHRGWYQDIMFLNINSLDDGDKIYLTTVLGKKLSYTVTDKEIITTYEWEKLKPKIGEDILTLLTCEFISPNAPYRLIVNAVRDKVENKGKAINNNKSVDSDETVNSIGDIQLPKKDATVVLIKYSIYAVTLFLWLAILFIIRKIFRNK